MKDRIDLVRGMLRKAESDLVSARLCIESGEALDSACFHCQQAAERCLKAYLVAHDIEFPFIHNLEKLIELCAMKDESFRGLADTASELTPYAVELRYDEEFWPDLATAHEAYEAVKQVHEFVTSRLPNHTQTARP